MLRIYLGRKLVDEVEEELVVSTAVSIVVDSQKDAMGVLFGVKTKQKFTVFQSCFGASFSSEYIDIFNKAVSEYSV